MLNQLSQLVNTVSGFVGGTSAATASAAHSTNDAAEPSRDRSPLSSRSPTTTSHRTRTAVDLTTSPRRKQISSFGLEHTTNLSILGRTQTGLDEVGRIPGKTKSGATPLPNPLYHFLDRHRDMGKPGASHAPQPRNTINQRTYRPPASAHKTYGQPSRSGYLNFPEADEQFSSNHHPIKKRRTGSDALHAISLYEEDVQEVVPVTQASRPESRHSAGSRRTSLSGSKDPRSEFDRAFTITNPHRKKSRTGNSKVNDDNALPTPITLDDDALDHSANSRRAQLQDFQQGIGGLEGTSTRQPIPGTTSRHFPPQMSHSTHPTGVSGQKKVFKAGSLRDKFQRAPVSGTSRHASKSALISWPLRWVRAHDFEERGEDILLHTQDTAASSYSITRTDTNDAGYEFSFKQIASAVSDHSSRIRLFGPVNVNDNDFRYIVDLEFSDKDDLTVFEKALTRSITQKQLKTRTEEDMRKIFNKPLDTPSTVPAITPVPRNREEIRHASIGSKGAGLINGLLGEKHNPVLQKPMKPVKAPTTQGDTARASTRPLRATRATQTFTLDPDDSEKTPRIDKHSEIYGLGTPWKRQLNYGSGRRRAVVDFNDLPRLDNGEFLNDQLIDFYLLYLFDHAKVPHNKVYIFNTHFFTTLTRKVRGQKIINYQGVARWTAKEDIFGYDYIVVPINQDVHWYLAIICNVSNIARVPVIEDLTKSQELGTEGSKEQSSEPSTEREAKIGKLVDSIPSPALADAPSEEISVPQAENEALDSEDSGLNVVDAHAPEPETCLNAPGDSAPIVESPAEETAKFKQLSLSDSKSEGILLSGSSPMPSPKKAKRKPGPPARKCDPEEPVIIVLDSLGGGAKTAAVRVLKEYILQEGKEKRGMEARIQQNGYYAKDSQIPQQQNFSDCGVYLLGYAQKFFEDPDKFKNRLLSGEMKVETDWPDMVMPTMRDGMREILHQLYKKQEAEREQAKKTKKSSNADSVADEGDNTVQQRLTAAEKEKSTAIEVSKEATIDPGQIGAFVEEKPSTLPEPQPRPRLASPFEGQPPSKRSRSRSLSVPVPIKIAGSPVPELKHPATSGTNGQHVSPNMNVRRRNKCPIAFTQSPVKKSPKRPREERVTRDGAGETNMKKPRTETKQDLTIDLFAKDRTDDSEPRIVGIRSPDPRTESSGRRRSKTSLLVSPSRGVSLPAEGTSRDPIPIDDSQENLASTPGSAKRRLRAVSEDPVLIVTSPKSSKKSIRSHPNRQQRQHMSSPAKFDHERGPPDTRKRRSPSLADDLDAELQADELDYYARQHQRSKTSKRKALTLEGDTAEESIEVLETPPREWDGMSPQE